MKLSFSSISNYLNCPRKFYEVNVTYAWRDASFATAKGEDIHGKIEKYINGTAETLDVPLDARLKGLMPRYRQMYADQGTEGHDYKVLVEQQYAVDENFQPCEWKSPKAILRGKVDFSIECPTNMSITDWKSGKMRTNSLQAHIYGLLVRPLTSAANLTCSFDYLDKGLGDSYQITDKGLSITKQIVEKVLEAKDFPERRNPLCPWCPVKSCSYWKEQARNAK